MCKVPSIDSQPTWREKENKNTYGDTWHWQELLINLWPSKRSYKFGDTFPYKLNLWYAGIWEAVKQKYREKILLQQIEEPTTNSTHMWRPFWDSAPGHTGGKRVLSPLHHPCSNKTKTMVCWIFLFSFFFIEKRITFFLYFNNNKLPWARIDTFGYCAAFCVRGPEFDSQMWPQIFTNLHL